MAHWNNRASAHEQGQRAERGVHGDGLPTGILGTGGVVIPVVGPREVNGACRGALRVDRRGQQGITAEEIEFVQRERVVVVVIIEKDRRVDGEPVGRRVVHQGIEVRHELVAELDVLAHQTAIIRTIRRWAVLPRIEPPWLAALVAIGPDIVAFLGVVDVERQQRAPLMPAGQEFTRHRPNESPEIVAEVGLAGNHRIRAEPNAGLVVVPVGLCITAPTAGVTLDAAVARTVRTNGRRLG